MRRKQANIYFYFPYCDKIHQIQDSDIFLLKFQIPDKNNLFETLFSGYECIIYLYLVRLRRTNIFNICILLAVWIWIYLIFVFGKIFFTSRKNFSCTCINIDMHQNLIHLIGNGVLKSLHCIYSILVFGQVPKN